MTVHRPFSFESDENMTLADAEKFCRDARAAGATSNDELRVRQTIRGGVRALKLRITLSGNREAAYRRDQHSKDTEGHA